MPRNINPDGTAKPSNAVARMDGFIVLGALIFLIVCRASFRGALAA